MLKKITMGIVSFLPIMYFLFFGIYLTSQISKIYDMTDKGMLPQELSFSTWVPILGIILFLVTLGVFITDVFKNNKVKNDLKAAWVIVLLIGNLIAMPIYWYLYVWKDGKQM